MAIRFPRPLAALAEASGVNVWALYKIEEGKRRPTAEQTVAIVDATGGAISRSDLRPDLWPPNHPSLPPAA